MSVCVSAWGCVHLCGCVRAKISVCRWVRRERVCVHGVVYLCGCVRARMSVCGWVNRECVCTVLCVYLWVREGLPLRNLQTVKSSAFASQPMRSATSCREVCVSECEDEWECV